VQASHTNAIAGHVEKMLAQVDAHNRELGVEVAAAAIAKTPAPNLPSLDKQPPIALRHMQDDQAGHALSVRIHLQELQPGHRDNTSQAGFLSANNSQTKNNAGHNCAGAPRTPKAALRKRLLEARNALGGVKIGDAPKRSSRRPQRWRGDVDALRIASTDTGKKRAGPAVLR
jgi:hypothetical protein